MALPVSAPFHCALMQPAADVMKQELAKATIRAPRLPLVANVTARPTDDPEEGPLVISSRPELLPEGPVEATAFKQLVLDHLFS